MSLDYDICEFCDGEVERRRMKSLVLRRKTGHVLLEDVEIGKCNKCGHEYYGLDLLKAVDDAMSGKSKPVRVDSLPVYHITATGTPG